MKKFFSLFIIVIMALAIVASKNSYASNNQLLTVKSTSKSDFVRLFFFCPQPVKFSPIVDGKYLKVEFDKPFKIDPKQIQSSLSNQVTFTTASEDGKTLLFTLNNDAYGYRKFIGEKFVGVDLIKHKNASKTKPSIKATQVSSVKTKSSGFVPKPKTKPSSPQKLIQQYQQTSVSNSDVPTQVAAIESTTISDEQNEVIENESESPETEKLPEIKSLQDIDDFYKPKDVVAVEKEKRQFITKSTIIFPWEEEVGASIFTRGDYLWAIFDKNKEINIDDIVNKNSGLFSNGEQIENQDYTILRFNLLDKVNIATYKEQNNWVIAVTEKTFDVENEPSVNITVSDLLGSKVVISSQKEVKPIRLIDPYVGDEMIVLPYKNAETGFNIPRKYTDFILMRTAQGGSIQLVSDQIDLETVAGKISIAGPTNKLAGSAQSSLRELKEREREAKLLAERLKQKGGELTMIQFNNWKMGGDKSYKNDLEELQWKITEVNWSDKNPHRLNLARFYLAHGLYAEALGVIRIIKEYDEKFSERNEVKIVKAAASYLFGKYEQAIESLNSIDTTNLKDWEKQEVSFWSTATNLQLGNLIKIDRFISDNPLNENKKNEDEIKVGNEVENTRLMWDTSSRLLKIIRKMDPDFVNSEEIQQLESTARFVTNHYHEAIKRFEESDLYKSGEIYESDESKLWWSTSENKGNEGVSLKFAENKDSFLKYYPDTIFNDFARLALEDKLKRNDLVASEEILSLFKEEERFQEKNSIEFLRGLFYAKDEESEKAIAIWEDLSTDIMDGYNRLRSQFALTVFLLRNKEIELSEAVDRLNSVRSAWRGGIVEFHALKLLGEFYMDQKKYMEGFRVWRNTIAAFPGSDEALFIAKKMSEKFVQVFSQGESDEMPRLEALTLYYEFRELTPIGKLGDEMISHLADLLIEVDLLDRAAALLTHQVRFRLIGEDKQSAAIKLVNVHLMNLQPQKALDVLNATQTNNLTPELELQRKYLKAHCLIEIGKSNSVLALLRGDESHKASFLRAEVYWKNKVWRKVVEELENPFRKLRREEKDLTLEETEQLLRLSVAYALTERKKRLQILYEDFAPFIKDEDRKKIFTFVATDRGPVDFRNLDYTVELGSIKTFLDKYIENNGAIKQGGET